MRSMVPPTSAAANNWERSSDEVEGLLRAYFRAQVPNPWPELKLPAEAARPTLRTVSANRSFWSSRSALAAAIAFLLIGTLALSAAFRGSRPVSHSGAGPFSAKGNPLGFTRPNSPSGPVDAR